MTVEEKKSTHHSVLKYLLPAGCSEPDVGFFLVFFKYFYCISSDFSDLPDITGEYIVLCTERNIDRGWVRVPGGHSDTK